MTLQEAATLHEGLFLAATLGGMLVARATPDGRFTVLHNLARPPDTREGCLPYPTWQPRTPASRPADSTRSCRYLCCSPYFKCCCIPAVSCLSTVLLPAVYSQYVHCFHTPSGGRLNAKSGLSISDWYMCVGLSACRSSTPARPLDHSSKMVRQQSGLPLLCPCAQLACCVLQPPLDWVQASTFCHTGSCLGEESVSDGCAPGRAAWCGPT